MRAVYTSFAQFISTITHPLLMVTYMLLFLLSVNPYMFGVRSIGGYVPYILMVAFSTILIPGLAVFMMRSLGLVKSIQLVDRTDRFGPLIVAIVFYSWLLINFYNNPTVPRIFVFILMGATIAIALSFSVNVFEKLSMHGVGFGGIITGVLIMSATRDYAILEMRLGAEKTVIFPIYLFLLFVILLAGLAGSSRLYLGIHNLREWVLGMAVGVIGQMLAFFILF